MMRKRFIQLILCCCIAAPTSLLKHSYALDLACPSNKCLYFPFIAKPTPIFVTDAYLFNYRTLQFSVEGDLFNASTKPVYDVVVTAEIYTGTWVTITPTVQLSVTAPNSYNAFSYFSSASGPIPYWNRQIRVVSWKDVSSAQYRAPTIVSVDSETRYENSVPYTFVAVTLRNDGDKSLRDVYGFVWSRGRVRDSPIIVSSLLAPSQVVTFTWKLYVQFPIPPQDIRVATYGTVVP